jgi:hypothetical protein
MAGAEHLTNRRTRPALAATWECAGIALLERIAPLVDYLEIPPDSIAATGGSGTHLRAEALSEIELVNPPLKLTVHGIGLSIASLDGWNEPYLRLLDEFFDRFTLEWHSEHLGYTTVNGENLGTMLAPERSDEMLDLICERVTRLQARYRAPFLLEHIVNILPDAPAPYTPAAFLNTICTRTGCGLILDARNLECDAANFQFDVAGFLSELDLTRVRELHLAGGTEHEGFQLDIHSRPTADSTLALALDIAARAPNLQVVTYEFLREAIPSLTHDGICNELARVRKAVCQ